MILWRKNVLALVGMGYAATIIVFVALMAVNMSVSEAYDIVSAPLMALIGGSLAIAKDLIRSEDDDSSNGFNNHAHDKKDGHGDPAPDE